MTVKLTNIWTGCYVGDGEYEGGCWNDRTYHNVKNLKDILTRLDKSIGYTSDDSDLIMFDWTDKSTGKIHHYRTKIETYDDWED